MPRPRIEGLRIRRAVVRRLLALFGASLPLLIVFNAPFAQASSNGAQIERNVQNYVLFALDSLSFKGGNESTHTKGWVLGGNVGVNNPDPNLGDNTIQMDVGANGLFKMSDNTQLVGGSIRLGPEASVWDAYRAAEAGSGWPPPPVVNPDIGGFTVRNAVYAIDNFAPDLPIIDP